MKRFISTLLIGTMLATSVPAYADPTPTPPPDISQLQQVVPKPPASEPSVGAAVSPMRMGQKAPFTGLLLSPEAVAKIVVELQNEQKECNIQITKSTETQKAKDQLIIDDLTSKVKYIQTTTDTIIKNRNDQITELTKKLEDAEKSKPNTPMWIGVGAVGGIVVSLLTVYAVSRITK